uniref:AIG1-type G domain-containing protein n=1 Tax=Astyanax mexicanus TaxID=7994 RepID=A0A8B9H307_ASTMX
NHTPPPPAPLRSTLNDLITKSVQFRSGPPAVYRLHTTRSNLDKDGKIRRWTFGQKHHNMQNKTILMVGELGTGKTTLINTMVNYYLGVKFEDLVWFEIAEEEKRDQTESHSSEITVYEIFSEQKPFSLSIIDTPGYGDTRGIDKDMEIPQNLHKLFLHETGVKGLDAVCLVLKASQNRISDAQRYIFEGVLSLFGKDIGENIVLFITYSDGLIPSNVLKAVEKEKIPCCHDAENEPVHFLFDNRQSEKHSTAKTKRAVKMGWEIGEESLEEFFEFLKSRERKSLTLTVNVLKERIQLEACVQSLKEHTELIEAKERELIKVNEDQMSLLSSLKELLAEKEKKRNSSVKEAYEAIIKLSEIALKPDSAFTLQHLDFLIPQLCYVMNDENCTVCKCHSTKHVKESRKHVTKQEEKEFTHVLKNEKDVTHNETVLKNVETEDEKQLEKKEELTDNEKMKNILLKDASELIMKLSKTTYSPLTLCYLDFLIPRVEEAGEEELAQKLKELQKRKISRFGFTQITQYMK